MNNYIIITAVLTVILLLVLFTIMSKKSNFGQPLGAYFKLVAPHPQLHTGNLTKDEFSYLIPEYIHHQMALNNVGTLHEIGIGPKPVSNARPGGPARGYMESMTPHNIYPHVVDPCHNNSISCGRSHITFAPLYGF